MTNSSRHFALLSAATALLVMLLGAGSIAGNLADHTGDLAHYFSVANRILHGEWPYRDFVLEYPALSLIPVMLPRLVLLPFSGSEAAYAWVFLTENALLTAALTWTTLKLSAQLWGQSTVRFTFLLLVVLLAVSPTLPWRYDLFPALLTAFALRALLSGHSVRAGIWLGLGTAAKLYPLLLLPLFVLYALAEKRRRGSLRMLAGCAAAVAVCLLPFVRLPLPVLLSFLTYHQKRGLEIESVPAGFILLAHVAHRASVSVIFNYGAFHIVSPLASAIIRLLPILFVLVTGSVLWRAWRSFQLKQSVSGIDRAESLIVYLIALLLGFILANKVFSPQYLIWLLPFVPLLRPRRVLLLAAVFILTGAIYPYSFWHLLQLGPRAILLLNLRNILALVAFVVLLGAAKTKPPAAVVE